MQTITSNSSRETLSEAQRAALVHLLSDDDPAVFRQIHDTILAQGPSARVWLQAYAGSDDARTRRRVRSLLNKLCAIEADNRFLSFCLTHGAQLDIEEGLFLLARSTHPDFNVEGYRALLDGYAAEVRGRVAPHSAPHRVLGTLNRLLFIQLGFRGNAEDCYHPDNSYLNRVLDSRTGDPLLLSAVYLCVCRRLELPVAGVGLPGHFLCRFQNAAHELYVDPSNGGRFLSRTDCVHHLIRNNCSPRDDYLGPINSGRMLVRCIHHLHEVYEQRGDRPAALRMRSYLLALTKRTREGKATKPAVTGPRKH